MDDSDCLACRAADGPTGGIDTGFEAKKRIDGRF